MDASNSKKLLLFRGRKFHWPQDATMVVSSHPTAFKCTLKSCGTQHELTIPKTPEQNRVAERLNCTLTRAMLLDGKLPHQFWAEAISTATYLRN